MVWGRGDGLRQVFGVFFLYLGKKKKKRPNIFPFLEFVRLFVVVQNLLFSLSFLLILHFLLFLSSSVPLHSFSHILPNSICCKKEK